MHAGLGPAQLKGRLEAGLSKLNSVRPLIVEVDVVSRRAEWPDGPRAIDGFGAYRSTRAPDSLERR